MISRICWVKLEQQIRHEHRVSPREDIICYLRMSFESREDEFEQCSFHTGLSLTPTSRASFCNSTAHCQFLEVCLFQEPVANISMVPTVNVAFRPLVSMREVWIFYSVVRPDPHSYDRSVMDQSSSTCLNPGLQRAVIKGMCCWKFSRRLRIWFTTSRLSPSNVFKSLADPLHLA